MESMVDATLIPRQLFLSGFVLLIACFIIIEKPTVKHHFTYIRNKALQCFAALFLIYLISNLIANTISESLYVSSKIGLEFVFLFITIHLFYNERLSKRAVTEGV